MKFMLKNHNIERQNDSIMSCITSAEYILAKRLPMYISNMKCVFSETTSGTNNCFNQNQASLNDGGDYLQEMNTGLENRRIAMPRVEEEKGENGNFQHLKSPPRAVAVNRGLPRESWST